MKHLQDLFWATSSMLVLFVMFCFELLGIDYHDNNDPKNENQ